MCSIGVWTVCPHVVKNCKYIVTWLPSFIVKIHILANELLVYLTLFTHVLYETIHYWFIKKIFSGFPSKKLYFLLWPSTFVVKNGPSLVSSFHFCMLTPPPWVFFVVVFLVLFCRLEAVEPNSSWQQRQKEKCAPGWVTEHPPPRRKKKTLCV